MLRIRIDVGKTRRTEPSRKSARRAREFFRDTRYKSPGTVRDDRFFSSSLFPIALFFPSLVLRDAGTERETEVAGEASVGELRRTISPARARNIRVSLEIPGRSVARPETIQSLKSPEDRRSSFPSLTFLFPFFVLLFALSRVGKRKRKEEWVSVERVTRRFEIYFRSPTPTRE